MQNLPFDCKVLHCCVGTFIKVKDLGIFFQICIQKTVSTVCFYMIYMCADGLHKRFYAHSDFD